MLSKFSEAGRLLWSNLGLFSAIILTVWLPGNLLVNYLTFYVYSDEESFAVFRAASWIEAIFGPLYVGAMIHALSELKQGRSPSYSVAMGAGLRNWAGLFAARFVAGLLIILGLIALVIPGIILMVRYALLDSVVVLEKAGPSDARRRSTELTVGFRGQIFGAGLLFMVAFILFGILIYLPLAFLPTIDTLATNVALDCLLDVVFAVIQIVMFLYYWHATEPESDVTESVPT